MAHFTNTHHFFPLMHTWFCHHNLLVCLENWLMQCMVKLDIVSVKILTNIICVPLAQVFRTIHVHAFVHFVSASRSRNMFLKIVKIHMKVSESESLFHKVAGFQPAVLLKRRLRLRCSPVNFNKF